MAVNRRDFLFGMPTAAALFANGSLFAAEPDAKPAPRVNRPPKRVAMINSIYRFRSHAYHLGRRILHGYPGRRVPHPHQLPARRRLDGSACP